MFVGSSICAPHTAGFKSQRPSTWPKGLSRTITITGLQARHCSACKSQPDARSMSQPIQEQPEAVLPAAAAVVPPAGGAADRQWVARPTNPSCPRGLEYLTQIDQLLVHQCIDLSEVATGFQAANSYILKNSMGQKVYSAFEDSGWCHRQWCMEYRGFVMYIVDNMEEEVMRMKRVFKCCAGCCWCANADCCSFTISVEAPVGEVIGYVKQRKSSCVPVYSITDATGSPVLHLRGPVRLCQAVCCTQDIDFPIYTNDDQTIGKISKQWAGCWQETFTTADNYNMSFPLDLDVRTKATLLGAVLLLDYAHFEYQPRLNSTAS